VKSVPLQLPAETNLSDFLLTRAAADEDVVAWQHGDDGLVGWGVAWSGQFGAAEQFSTATSTWRKLVSQATVTDEVNAYGSGLVAFGSFAFDPQSAATALLVVPRFLIGRRGNTAWLTIVDVDCNPDQVLGMLDDVVPTLPEPEVTETGTLLDSRIWMAEVEAALEQIEAGVAAKVVLAREVQLLANSELDAAWLLRRLNSRYHSTFNYAVADLVGATPEMLVKVKENQVSSIVLAGTVPLPENASPTQIDALSEQLLQSPKDLSEHSHAVQSVEDALTLAGTEVTRFGPHILELPNVLHLATDLTARLPSGTDPAASLDLAGRLHPSAAVCGTPREAALALIREYEDFDRGRYAGPVGWLSGKGEGEWGIALRCAQLDQTKARLFAGCGIVSGSNPAVELLESEAKLLPLRWALKGSA
jgi:menaquinone-specific isochorismate synthase